ncbi:MAG: GNAT family N-acetyltransferase [Marinomonas sp.]
MTIEIRHGSLADVLAIHQNIPEFDRPLSEDMLLVRLENIESLVLVAYNAEQAIGYKLGYAINEQEFYSWLGGVIPCARNQGIANRLRQTQENWAQKKGYQSISVKSMNQYPAMLHMLTSNGYQISGYENNGDLALNKICFVKRIMQLVG